MKTTILTVLTILCLGIVIKMNAQNSMGVGTNSPNQNAVLELVSPNNNQGFLVPRITTAQRTDPAFEGNLNASDIGLLIFDNDDQSFYFWNGSRWVLISEGTTPIQILNPGSIPRWDGVNLVDGTLVDDGTNVSTNNDFTVGGDLTINGTIIGSGGQITNLNIDSVGGQSAETIDLAVSLISNNQRIDLDSLNDVTLTTSPAPGDIAGNYTDGFTIVSIEGINSVDLAAAINLINNNPSLDLDSTDDLTISTVPVPGDISGDFATGLVVDSVGGQSAVDIANVFNLLNSNPAIDLDSTNDLTVNTPAALGDISGDFTTGLTVDSVGGEAATDVATAVNLVNSNPNIDLDDTDDITLSNTPNLDVDATDDLALTTTPTPGDITGNYSIGLTVDSVGGEAATDVATAVNLVNSNPNIDLDATDDLALTTTPTPGDITGNYSIGLTVDSVGGEAATDVATAVNLVNSNPNIDLDATDDIQDLNSVLSAGNDALSQSLLNVDSMSADKLTVGGGAFTVNGVGNVGANNVNTPNVIFNPGINSVNLGSDTQTGNVSLTIPNLGGVNDTIALRSELSSGIQDISSVLGQGNDALGNSLLGLDVLEANSINTFSDMNADSIFNNYIDLAGSSIVLDGLVGFITADSVSATTYFGDGSNLSGIGGSQNIDSVLAQGNDAGFQNITGVDTLFADAGNFNSGTSTAITAASLQNPAA
ncbi:MAG TPA: beta strand repeat-containing protein, partial [Cyclobacteriaceae bacterium]